MNSISNDTSALSAYISHSAGARAHRNGGTASTATSTSLDSTMGPTSAGSDSVQLSPAAARQMLQGARIAYDEKQGNLTSDQATQLYSQMSTIHQQIATDKQNDGGSLNAADAQAINLMQNTMSNAIHEMAHGDSMTPNPPGDPIASA